MFGRECRGTTIKHNHVSSVQLIYVGFQYPGHNTSMSLCVAVIAIMRTPCFVGKYKIK